MTNESEDKRFERLSRNRFTRPMPKRFYKEVAVSAAREILLDGRPVKTPLKQPLTMPTMLLAEAVAEEWRSQSESIDLLRMPLTKLANTAIDRAPHERLALIDELVAYAGSDLVCYRATEPAALVHRQAEQWDPVLHWAEAVLGVSLRAVDGLLHVPQPREALEAVRRKLVDLNGFNLVALHAIVTLSGSALLGLMLAKKAINPEVAWAAANLDERWQTELWGEDDEARLRTEARWNEFSAAVRFLNLAAAAP
jgi:chaperone required for assembly of F1-ATPase